MQPFTVASSKYIVSYKIKSLQNLWKIHIEEFIEVKLNRGN